MHKLYKESSLYDINNENINAVEQITNMVVFHMQSVFSSSINCEDSHTATLVFQDVCNRLTENTNFIKVKKFLINLENVTEVVIKKSDANYSLSIMHDDKYATTVFCKDEQELNELYLSVQKLLDDYRASKIILP